MTECCVTGRWVSLRLEIVAKGRVMRNLFDNRRYISSACYFVSFATVRLVTVPSYRAGQDASQAFESEWTTLPPVAPEPLVPLCGPTS